MDIKRNSYELAKVVLRPPILLVAATPCTKTEGSQFEDLFDSLDAAYVFFR